MKKGHSVNQEWRGHLPHSKGYLCRVVYTMVKKTVLSLRYQEQDKHSCSHCLLLCAGNSSPGDQYSIRNKTPRLVALEFKAIPSATENSSCSEPETLPQKRKIKTNHSEKGYSVMVNHLFNRWWTNHENIIGTSTIHSATGNSE